MEIPEIPKYRKKRGAMTPKKSNHKHDYQDVIGKVEMKDSKFYYMPYFKCSICGQLQSGKMFFIDKEKGEAHFSMFSDLEDIIKQYPGLEIVEIKR